MSEMTAQQLDAIVKDAMNQPASSWGDVARFFTSILLNKPEPLSTPTTPAHIALARNTVSEVFAPEGSAMTTAPATVTSEELETNETPATQKPGFFVRMGQSMWKNKESIIVGGAVSYLARAALAAKFVAAAGTLCSPATAAIVGGVTLGATLGGVVGIIRDSLSKDEDIIAARTKKYWWVKSFAKGAGFGALGGVFGTVGVDMIREAVTSEPVIAALNVVTDAWKNHAAPALTTALTTANGFVIEKADAYTAFKASAHETVKSAMLKTQDFCAALPEKSVAAAKETANFISSKVGAFFSSVGDMLTLSKPPMVVEGILPTPADTDTLAQAVTKTSGMPTIDVDTFQKTLAEITPPEPEIPAKPIAPVLPEVPAKFKDFLSPEAFAHLSGNEKMATWLKQANSDNAAKSLRALKEITVSLMNSSDETVRTSAGRVMDMMYDRAVQTGMTETPIGNEIERTIAYAYAKGGFGLVKNDLAASTMALFAEPDGDKFTKGLLANMEAKKPAVFEKAMKVVSNARQFVLPRGPIPQNG